jgi:hypothetical protein
MIMVMAFTVMAGMVMLIHRRVMDRRRAVWSIASHQVNGQRSGQSEQSQSLVSAHQTFLLAYKFPLTTRQ